MPPLPPPPICSVRRPLLFPGKTRVWPGLSLAGDALLFLAPGVGEEEDAGSHGGRWCREKRDRTTQGVPAPTPAQLLQTPSQVRLREGPPRHTLVRSPESLLSWPRPLPCRPPVAPLSLAKVAIPRGTQRLFCSASPPLGTETLAPTLKGRGSEQAEATLVLLPLSAAPQPLASLCRQAAASGGT